MAGGAAGTRLLSSEVINSYTQSGKYVDPITVVEIASRLLESIAHDAKSLGISRRDDLVAFIESVSSGVTSHAIIHNSLAIAAEVADSSDNVWGAIAAIERLSSILSSYASHTIPRGIAASCKQAFSAFQRKVTVATIGYSRLVLSCIRGAQAKIYGVNILEARPQGDGLRMARAASKLGVRARVFPDLAAGHIAIASDAAVVPVDTVSYDGFMLVRMGTRPLLLAALDQGKHVLGLSPLLGFTATLSILNEPPVSAKIYIGEFNEHISVRLHDKVEFSKLTHIATEAWLRHPEEVDVEEVSYAFIDDMLARLTGESGHEGS